MNTLWRFVVVVGGFLLLEVGLLLLGLYLAERFAQ